VSDIQKQIFAPALSLDASESGVIPHRQMVLPLDCRVQRTRHTGTS
jgi:hypothetical protein